MSYILMFMRAFVGGLSIAIEGPSKAEILCNDMKDGTYACNYRPMLPGEYVINIKFMEKHIVGSPFHAHIEGAPRRRAQMTVGTGGRGEISLPVTDVDLTSLMATVKAPSGKEEPCILKRTPQGHLGMHSVGDTHLGQIGIPFIFITHLRKIGIP